MKRVKLRYVDPGGQQLRILRDPDCETAIFRSNKVKLSTTCAFYTGVVLG
jgi:hypothetical protein